MRERRHRDPRCAELAEERERQGSSGRRRLDGPRPRRERGLHVPQCERTGDVRVLNRAPFPINRAPHRLRAGLEGDAHEPGRRRVERNHARDRSPGDPHALSFHERWWRRTVLRSLLPIAPAEEHRAPARRRSAFVREEAKFEGRAVSAKAAKRRGQRRGVVDDEEIPRAEARRQRAHPRVDEAVARGIDPQEPFVRGIVARPGGGDHGAGAPLASTRAPVDQRSS